MNMFGPMLVRMGDQIQLSVDTRVDSEMAHVHFSMKCRHDREVI